MANITTTTAAASIPVLMAKEAQLAYTQGIVVSKLVNTSYKSMMTDGDTVDIVLFDSLTASDKIADTAMTPTANTLTKISIVVDKHKYVCTRVEKIAQLQSRLDLVAQYGKQHGIALAKAVEQSIFDEYVNAGDTVGTAATPLTLATVAGLAVKFDENNLPIDGRNLVLSPKAGGELRADLLALNYAVGTITDESVKMAKLGFIEGFNVYISNYVVKTGVGGTDTHNIAFVRDAIALVVQGEVDIEVTNRPEYKAAEIDSDVIYGLKTIRPEALFEVLS